MKHKGTLSRTFSVALSLCVLALGCRVPVYFGPMVSPAPYVAEVSDPEAVVELQFAQRAVGGFGGRPREDFVVYDIVFNGTELSGYRLITAVSAQHHPYRSGALIKGQDVWSWPYEGAARHVLGLNPGVLPPCFVAATVAHACLPPVESVRYARWIHRHRDAGPRDCIVTQGRVEFRWISIAKVRLRAERRYTFTLADARPDSCLHGDSPTP